MEEGKKETRRAWRKGQEIGERYQPPVRGRKMRHRDLTRRKPLHFFMKIIREGNFLLGWRERKEEEGRRGRERRGREDTEAQELN